MRGFVSRWVNQRDTSRRQRLDFTQSGLWPCVRLLSVKRQGKPYYTLFGRVVVLPIDNFTKNRRETEIIRYLKVALCQTREDKEAKRNLDYMIF